MYAAGDVSRRTFLVRGSVLGLSVSHDGQPDRGMRRRRRYGDARRDLGARRDLRSRCHRPDATSVPTPTPPPPAGEIQQGGTLRIASQRPGSPLDPVAMDNIGSYTPVVQSFEYLCGKGEGAALAPMLAESWSPNDDGSVWTFNLRQGVKWHTGGDFTAADVVATMGRLAGSQPGGVDHPRLGQGESTISPSR